MSQCRLNHHILTHASCKTVTDGAQAVFSGMVVRGINQWPPVSAPQQMVAAANAIE